MMTDKQKESPGGTAACPSDGTAGSDIGSGIHRSSDLVRPGERVDDLQRAGLRIIQDPELFCFGMDAVLLSAYVRMKKARRGLDLGTGNGIIPILLSDRTDCLSLTGLEIQEASADLAKRSVALNGLGDRISIVRGDIREADRIFAAASFDFITCNPPYRQAGRGKITGTPAGGGKAIGTSAGSGKIAGTPGGESGGQNQKNSRQKGNAGSDQDAGASGIDPRAIARHEILCSFEDVVRAAAALLRPGGHFYLVHRPLRLAELIAKLCAGGLEPKRMRLVYPHVDKAPNMVLLDCVRGGAPELRVEPPLIVYDENGAYTPELLEIYYGDS
jgi:tRNA1Val (adenine37-N6)-methyltransferase